MSWTFQGTGKPEAVARAIDNAIKTYTGQSLKEFELAAPHLKELVALNTGAGLLVSVEASGHASFDANGVKTYGVCAVKIGQLHGFVE